MEHLILEVYTSLVNVRGSTIVFLSNVLYFFINWHLFCSLLCKKIIFINIISIQVCIIRDSPDSEAAISIAVSILSHHSQSNSRIPHQVAKRAPLKPIYIWWKCANVTHSFSGGKISFFKRVMQSLINPFFIGHLFHFSYGSICNKCVLALHVNPAHFVPFLDVFLK